MADEAHDHLDAAQIADLDAGLLTAMQAEGAEQHLRTCLSCQQVRSDLAELPSLLAAAPAPTVPAEVAARLDTALARAAQDRTSEQRRATVTALSSRRRRFLLPVAAAAAAAAAVGFLIPGIDLGGRSSSEDSTTAGDASFEEAAGGAGNDDAGEMERRLPELGTASFGNDVATELYQKPAAEKENSAATSARDQRLSAYLDRSGCAPSPIPAGARLQAVLLDEQRATLLTYGPLERRVAVAYTCAEGRPVVQARAVLDLR